MAELKNVEVMRVGKWKGSQEITVTQAMLAEIAKNFTDINSVEGYGVPVKLGHNDKVGEPAYGWMSSLNVRGPSLFADFTDVPSEIVDAVRQRRYNATSVELLPSMTYQGKTFNNVLSGVAFLGAEHPAVKGMKPLSAAEFAEATNKLILTQEIDVTLKFTQEDNDNLVLAAETKVRTEMQALVTASEAAKLAAETRANVAEAALKLANAETTKQLFSAAIDAAITKGVVLAKQRDTMLAFAAKFPAEVEVGGKTVLAIDAFKEFLSGLPVKVKFGEALKAKPATDGASTEKAADAVNSAVQAYMAANPTVKNYEVAMQAVFAADPDLKTRYATEM